MQLNYLIFPKPEPSYTKTTFNNQKDIELIFIRNKHSKPQYEIPCLFLKADSDQYIIYFHGNAEDMYNIFNRSGSSFDFVFTIRNSLNVNIIAVEYPGYGIYTDKKPSQSQIEQDAQAVYIFCQLIMKIPEDKIIIFGRSIGTYPACFIASIYTPKALLLFSPFTSIKAVAKQHFNVLSFLVKDQFDNLAKAASIRSPCLVIHGKKDKLISYEQADVLYKRLGSQRKQCYYSEFMNHNDFHFTFDLKEPIVDFLTLIDELNKMLIKNI